MLEDLALENIPLEYQPFFDHPTTACRWKISLMNVDMLFTYKNKRSKSKTYSLYSVITILSGMCSFDINFYSNGNLMFFLNYSIVHTLCELFRL